MLRVPMDGANGISRTTRLALAVLGTGLALGVLADALLRATP